MKVFIDMQSGKKTHLSVIRRLTHLWIYVSRLSRNYYNNGEKIYKVQIKSGWNVVEHNLIFETANKIINKQGKSVMLDFFTNCSDFCQ